MTLLRNAIPWAEMHSRIIPMIETDTVAWVGGWTKKGLRDWGAAMERILSEFPTWRWELFGPSYGRASAAIADDVFYDLRLPPERVQIRNLAMAEMLRRLTTARIVGVSLGNECGPSSVLDGHAMGKPVVSGNDVVYSFANPCHTGLRASNSEEIYRAVRTLIESKVLRQQMGTAGRELVLREYTEKSQGHDLEQMIQQIEMLALAGPSAVALGTSAWKETVDDVGAMLQRKLRKRRARIKTVSGRRASC
jgi:hypothetical protein